MSAMAKRKNKMIQMSRWAINNRGLSSVWVMVQSEPGGGKLSGGHEGPETEKNTFPGKHKRKRISTVFCLLIFSSRPPKLHNGNDFLPMLNKNLDLY